MLVRSKGMVLFGFGEKVMKNIPMTPGFKAEIESFRASRVAAQTAELCKVLVALRSLSLVGVECRAGEIPVFSHISVATFHEVLDGQLGDVSGAVLLGVNKDDRTVSMGFDVRYV